MNSIQILCWLCAGIAENLTNILAVGLNKETGLSLNVNPNVGGGGLGGILGGSLGGLNLGNILGGLGGL